MFMQEQVEGIRAAQKDVEAGERSCFGHPWQARLKKLGIEAWLESLAAVWAGRGAGGIQPGGVQ